MLKLNLKNGMKRILVGLVSAALLISAVPMSAIAAVGDSYEIKAYDPQMHHDYANAYHIDYNGHEMPVFCFDITKLWPDHGGTGIPNYTEISLDTSKLTPEVQNKLRRAMYAGCPFNGADLFDENHILKGKVHMTLAQFNELVNRWEPEFVEYLRYLDVPGVEELPEKGANGFFEIDSNSNVTKHGDLMYEIVSSTIGINDSEVQDKLDSFTCYYAWKTVISYGDYMPASMIISVFLYDGVDDMHATTQAAVWRILDEAGAVANGSGWRTTPSEEAIYNYAVNQINELPIPNGEIKEQDVDGKIVLKDVSKGTEIGANDIKFSKSTKNGKYYSQSLVIEAQKSDSKPMYKTDYEVSYSGSSATQTVTSDESFRLVLDEMPAEGGTLKINTTLTWPSELHVFNPPADAQYSVHGYDGKDVMKSLQPMGGIYIRKKELTTTNLTYEVEQYGSLEISKVVTGKKDANDTDGRAAKNKTFEFTVDITDAPAGYFTEGGYLSATIGSTPTKVKCTSSGRLYDIKLKDGESIVINDLPIGAKYTVNENFADLSHNWTHEYTNRQGTISEITTDTATVTNHFNKVFDKPVTVTLTGKKEVKNFKEAADDHPVYKGETDRGVNGVNYEFVLWPMDNESPMPEGYATLAGTKVKEVNNDNNGVINFGTLSFNKEGVYEYTIEEDQTVEVENISKDPHHWEVKVVVEDSDNNGELDTPTVTYERHHQRYDSTKGWYCDKEDYKTLVSDTPLTFVNTYAENRLTEQIIIEKVITGEPNAIQLSKAGYEFRIEPADSDKSKYPSVNGDKGWTVKTSTAGQAVSPEIVMDAGWFSNAVEKDAEGKPTTNEIVLNYNVKEVQGNVPGMTYNTKVASAKIHVEKTSSGYNSWIEYSGDDLERTDALSRMPLVFKNAYHSTSVQGKLYVNKNFTPSSFTPRNGEAYTFTVTPGNGAPAMDSIVLTADNTGNLNQSGGTATFTKEGDYTYTIKEADLNGKAAYDGRMRKSNAEWKATIHVGDNGRGNLEIVSVYYNRVKDDDGNDDSSSNRDATSATFTNNLTNEAGISFDINKLIYGRDWADGEEFEFDVTKIYDDSWGWGEFNPIKESGTTETVTMVKSDNGVKTATATFDMAGTYYLFIKEKAQTSSGKKSSDLTYDSSTYVVEVYVDEDWDTGELSAVPVATYGLTSSSVRNSKWDERVVVNKVNFKNKVNTLTGKFSGTTVTIGNQVDFNFYLGGLDDETVNNYFIRFKYNNGEESDIVRNFRRRGDLYGFKYSNVYAYNANDKIVANLYYEDPTTHKAYFMGSKTSSIKEYADSVIEKSRIGKYIDNDTYLPPVMMDMLNYCTNTQKYAIQEKWTSAIKEYCNSKLTPEERARVHKDTVPTDKDAAEIKGSATNINDVEAYLEASEGMNFTMYIKFKLKDADEKNYDVILHSDADDLLTYNGKEKDANGDIHLDKSDLTLSDDGSYSIYIKNIPPFFWGHKYELRFMDGDTEKYSIKYSINTYIYDMLNRYNDPNDDFKDKTLADMLHSMYLYQITADAWFNNGSVIKNN